MCPGWAVDLALGCTPTLPSEQPGVALIRQPAASPEPCIPTSRFPLRLPLIAWRAGSLAVGVALVSAVSHSDDVILDRCGANAVRSSDPALVAVAFENSPATRSMLGATRACA